MKKNITKDIRTILENSLRKELIEYLDHEMNPELVNTILNDMYLSIRIKGDSLRMALDNNLYGKLL